MTENKLFHIMLQEYPHIIDAHAHVYPEKIAAKAAASIGEFYRIKPQGKGTVLDLLDAGNKAGIHRFLVSSAALTPNQVKPINNFIASVCSDHPELIGFGTIHPDLADANEEIDRMIERGLRGVKIHPDCQKVYIDAPSFLPIYKKLEGRLPVLFHVGDQRVDFSDPMRLVRILQSFPQLTVIAAHLGAYSIWKEQGDILLGRNLYLDTSSTLMHLEKEEAVEVIRRHGADKVLFGTDYPMWSHGEELQRFLELGLTAEENRQILWGNLERLLSLPR